MCERNSFGTGLTAGDKNIQNFKNSVAKVWGDIVRCSEVAEIYFRTHLDLLDLLQHVAYGSSPKSACNLSKSLVAYELLNTRNI